MMQANPAETIPERTHYRACNLCEAICGLEIRVRGTEILSIRGDAADPLSRGHICPKAVALKDIHQDPDRLRKPMRRTAEGWEEISWDAALDLAAERLVAISQQHGAASIAAYYGNPNVHNYGSMTHGSRALAPLKTRSRYSATSVDQLPHQLLAFRLRQMGDHGLARRAAMHRRARPSASPVGCSRGRPLRLKGRAPTVWR